MDIVVLILRLIASIGIAMIAGKLISKVKMPAILGWLIAGMIIGPFGVSIFSQELLDATWYFHISQFAGVMIGIMMAKELILKEMKEYGLKAIVIALFESLGTFIVVTLCFGVLFLIMDIPLYLAALFGAIALATAPGPSLSIVNQFHTKGSLTNNLIPISILDDVIAIVVFFVVNASVGSANGSDTGGVLMSVLIGIGLPIVVGIALGFVAKYAYRAVKTKKGMLFLTLGVALITYIISFAIDTYIFGGAVMNNFILGIAMFTTVTNSIPKEKVDLFALACTPVMGISILVFILNLAAPLDYRLIFGAGLLTAVYIISRAIGKYFSTYLGAKVSKSDDVVKKYLGLTLLPHSGVSLVFTSMAVTTLLPFDPASAALIQGTIAAAAVINEIIAVIVAKKAFDMAGEIK